MQDPAFDERWSGVGQRAGRGTGTLGSYTLPSNPLPTKYLVHPPPAVGLLVHALDQSQRRRLKLLTSQADSPWALEPVVRQRECRSSAGRLEVVQTQRTRHKQGHAPCPPSRALHCRRELTLPKSSGSRGTVSTRRRSATDPKGQRAVPWAVRGVRPNDDPFSRNWPWWDKRQCPARQQRVVEEWWRDGRGMAGMHVDTAAQDPTRRQMRQTFPPSRGATRPQEITAI